MACKRNDNTYPEIYFFETQIPFEYLSQKCCINGRDVTACQLPFREHMHMLLS